MRFIVMHKVTAEMEAGKVVDKSVVTNMGKYIGESIKAGVFENGAGLKASAHRTRLVFRGSDCSVKNGPYVGTNELLAGFAMIQVKSRDEAMHWARRFAQVVGDVELELGPVVEAWDIGLAPVPTRDVPLHFLLLSMADKGTEAGKAPSEREVKEMGALMEEMKKEGVLQAAEGLLPSSQAVRLQYKQGKRTVIDGPFAESKELIAGFSIIKLGSREEAVAWTDKYAAILGDIEVDVLRLHDIAAF